MSKPKIFTAVFRNITNDEAGEITSHPKWSAGSWSHALDDRDDARHALEAANARIAELEAQIATVAPAVDAQPVGEIAHNEIDGFHFAPSVHWLKIGIGTKLYATPQSEGLRKDADLSLRALYEDACIQANKNAQDAARWRYAVRHWLDEHIATKQADEAIAALSKQDPQ